ncbi:MAG: hypothetical protein ACRDHJ_07275 [Actinomycetota bacterium]
MPDAVTVPPGTASTSRRTTESLPDVIVRFDPGWTDDWFWDVDETVHAVPCNSAGTACVARTWTVPGSPFTTVLMGITIVGTSCAPAGDVSIRTRPKPIVMSSTAGVLAFALIGRSFAVADPKPIRRPS